MLDETGRLAGRGAYLCRDEGCLATARAKSVLQRALSAVPQPGVWDALEDVRRTTTTKTTMMTTTNEGGIRGEE